MSVACRIGPARSPSTAAGPATTATASGRATVAWATSSRSLARLRSPLRAATHSPRAHSTPSRNAAAISQGRVSNSGRPSAPVMTAHGSGPRTLTPGQSGPGPAPHASGEPPAEVVPDRIGAHPCGQEQPPGRRGPSDREAAQDRHDEEGPGAVLRGQDRPPARSSRRRELSSAPPRRWVPVHQPLGAARRGRCPDRRPEPTARACGPGHREPRQARCTHRWRWRRTDQRSWPALLRVR